MINNKGDKMKTQQTTLMLILLVSLVACGGQVDNSNISSNDTNTGTVEVIGEIGQSEALASVSYLTKEEIADEIYVRNYRVSLGDSEDCAEASFVDIFDETADTSDCADDPEDLDLFMDISDNPVFGSSDAIAAGTYSCVKVTICDKLVWNSAALEECPGTNVTDVTDPRDEAAVVTFYYSISAEEVVDSSEYGSAELPFPLTESLEVLAGETTTLTFEMSNSDSLEGMVAQYDDEAPEIFQCGIPAPEMTISSE